MATFIINNKIYDTSKMDLIGNVKKWYEYKGYLFIQLYGKGYGRVCDCTLYRSKKGNWLLTREDLGVIYGEAITEEEAKKLLMQHDYNAYAKIYGNLEEA